MEFTKIDWSKIDNNIKQFSLSGKKYIGKCVDVYDGDTVKVVFAVDGMDDVYRWNCRINRVDTPEIRTKNKKEKEFAKVVRDKLREKILNKLVIVDCLDFDKYGRLLAEIYHSESLQLEKDHSISKELLNNFGKVINGGLKEELKEELKEYSIENISDFLIKNEYAKPYDGGKKTKWFTE